MEHPFTWYNLLPQSVQHAIGDHTFFAVVSAVVLLLFAVSARRALATAQDPATPAAGVGSRNVAELLLQMVVTQSDQIIGHQGRKYVPFFATFFLFILFSNLMGLFPGFSPPTGNLNTTLGLALCAFIGYNVIGVREQGGAYFKHFIGPMTSLPARSILGKVAFLPVLLISATFFFILEVFSHGFRPVSLSLRLFGNMMGDHEVIFAFINLTKVIVPVAFYAMGTLVSIIQAFVFTLLTMIYVALAISHSHDEDHAHDAHPAEQAHH
jgi:F-type H+-transporting ATPase subunit a